MDRRENEGNGYKWVRGEKGGGGEIEGFIKERVAAALGHFLVNEYITMKQSNH